MPAVGWATHHVALGVLAQEVAPVKAQPKVAGDDLPAVQAVDWEACSTGTVGCCGAQPAAGARAGLTQAGWPPGAYGLQHPAQDPELAHPL